MVSRMVLSWDAVARGIHHPGLAIPIASAEHAVKMLDATASNLCTGRNTSVSLSLRHRECPHPAGRDFAEVVNVP